MMGKILLIACFLATVTYAWEPLPTYHGQELYRNFTNAALISKNYGTFTLKCTESMLPEFTCRDTLIIVPVWGKAKEGDIIVTSSQDKALWIGRPDYIIHRVIAKYQNAQNQTRYSTKGDNNDYEDTIVTEPRHFNWRVVGKWVRATGYGYGSGDGSGNGSGDVSGSGDGSGSG